MSKIFILPSCESIQACRERWRKQSFDLPGSSKMTELLITAALRGCWVRLWSKTKAGDGPRPANWCRHGRECMGESLMSIGHHLCFQPMPLCLCRVLGLDKETKSVCPSASQSDEGLLLQASHQQDQPELPGDAAGEGLSQQLPGGGSHPHTPSTQGQFLWWPHIWRAPCCSATVTTQQLGEKKGVGAWRGSWVCSDQADESIHLLLGGCGKGKQSQGVYVCGCMRISPVCMWKQKCMHKYTYIYFIYIFP